MGGGQRKMAREAIKNMWEQRRMKRGGRRKKKRRKKEGGRIYLVMLIEVGGNISWTGKLDLTL